MFVDVISREMDRPFARIDLDPDAGITLFVFLLVTGSDFGLVTGLT